MFGPKRNSAADLCISILKSVGSVTCLILVYILFLEQDDITLLDMGWILLFLLAAPIQNVLTYYFCSLEVTENILVYRSGWIMKSVEKIPLEKITTIDVSQKLLYRIFNVYQLRIDTSSSESKMGTMDVTMVYKAEVVEELRKCIYKNKEETNLQIEGQLDGKQLIEKKKTSNEQEEKTFRKISFLQFFCLGLLENKIKTFLKALVFLNAIYGVIVVVFSETPDKFLELTVTKIEGVLAKNLLIGSVGMIAILMIVLAIISGVATVIKYYNFNIQDHKDKIVIQYGLLNKKNYSLARNKISGVVCKQSLMMRLFSYYRIDLLMIGYGATTEKNASEEAVLFPFVHEKYLNEVLQEIDTDFQINKKTINPQKKGAYLTYGYISIVIVLVVGLGSLFLSIMPLVLGGIGAFVLPLIYIICYQRTCGVHMSQSIMTLYEGALERKIKLLKVDHIDSLGFVSTRLKKRLGIGNLVVMHVGPMLQFVIKIENIKTQDYEALTLKLKY